MDVIMWFVDLGWKILAIVMGFLILKFILRNGGETIKDILETIHLGMQALSIKCRLLLREYLSKEKDKKKESRKDKNEEDDEPITMTLDEWKKFDKFVEAMNSGKPFTFK